MWFFKSLTVIFLACFIISCGSKNGSNKRDFSLSTNAEKGNISIDENLNITLINKKGHKVDSVIYKLNGKRINENLELIDYKLGKQSLEANVYFNGTSQTASTPITILNNELPKVYKYKIINEYPHDITSYTQGLEFHNDTLYESTGQYGQSKLRKLDYKTGTVFNNVDLAKEYFGEGVTVLYDKVYQLTWKKGTGFIYDANTLEKISSFKYGNSKEGWGLCNDGFTIFKSDGTEHIWQLNPETLAEQDYIQVYTNKGKIVGINEMEWIDGKIYANRYQKDGVAIINPKNGAVIGVVDFSPLKRKVTQHEGLDVLNGIAYNPATKTIFVTGKRWDKLFEVEIVGD